MTQHATGSFEVTLAPQPWPEGEPLLGRRTIEKRFVGELDAGSLGQMLSAGTAVAGSAAYVAIERVNGTLQGRRGSFVLQHSATMDRGTPTLNIAVVPDSGTDALAGLRGTMRIRIEGGRHFYDFDYTLD